MKAEHGPNVAIESVVREALHIKLKNQVFLVLSAKQGQFSGAYFDFENIKSTVKRFTLDFIEKRDLKPIQCQYKVIGSQRAIDEIASVFEELKCKEHKRVIRKEDFEVIYQPSTGKLRVSKESMPASNGNSVTDSGLNKRKKIKVLIVDDSKPIRTLLKRVLSNDPEIEIIGIADKPSAANKVLERETPDIITLDIHMPEMNGVEYLKQILQRKKIPVVMISSISLEEGSLVLDALQAGAVDYFQKPTLEKLPLLAPIMVEKIKQAASAKVRAKDQKHLCPVLRHQLAPKTDHLVLIGSSTGGTNVLQDMLVLLPKSIPPILITQHIPPVFSKAFADRLNNLCPFKVTEATHGEAVAPGTVFVAPGGAHMGIKKQGKTLVIELSDEAPINQFKPSVDYLFNSALSLKDQKMLGIILTGMGKDGAKGLLQLKKHGAHTIAQDEESCVVFGMPREAIEIGAADEILSPAAITEKIIMPIAARKGKRKAA